MPETVEILRCLPGETCATLFALCCECKPGLMHCRCMTSRELLKHHQKCTASDCPVCTPVKQYVQKQRMVMQKQQQESLRLREAERHRYGESRPQVYSLQSLSPGL